MEKTDADILHGGPITVDTDIGVEFIAHYEQGWPDERLEIERPIPDGLDFKGGPNYIRFGWNGSYLGIRFAKIVQSRHRHFIGIRKAEKYHIHLTFRTAVSDNFWEVVEIEPQNKVAEIAEEIAGYCSQFDNINRHQWDDPFPSPHVAEQALEEAEAEVAEEIGRLHAVARDERRTS